MAIRLECPRCRSDADDLRIFAPALVVLEGRFHHRPKHRHDFDAIDVDCSTWHIHDRCAVHCECGWHGTVGQLAEIDVVE